MSLGDAMARLHDEYIVHYNDENWVFRTWFAQTESGEHAAKALSADESQPVRAA